MSAGENLAVFKHLAFSMANLRVLLKGYNCKTEAIPLPYSRKQKHVLLFRKSEMWHFKVSITNMLHFFVCPDRKLKFCEASHNPKSLRC